MKFKVFYKMPHVEPLLIREKEIEKMPSKFTIGRSEEEVIPNTPHFSVVPTEEEKKKIEEKYGGELLKHINNALRVVSRHHATLEKARIGFRFRDESKNGTIIEIGNTIRKTRKREELPIRLDKANFRIGNIHIRFGKR